MRRGLWVIAALVLFAGPVLGQDREPAAEVREAAEEVLSAPEFRHFPRLAKPAGHVPVRGSSEMPFGQGADDLFPGEGDGGEGAGGRRRGANFDWDAEGEAGGGPEKGRRGRWRQPLDDANQGGEAPRRAPASGDTPESFAGSGGGFADFMGALFHVVAWTILAAVCAAIGYLIFRAIRDFRWPARTKTAKGSTSAESPLEPEQSPGEVPADVFVARARELAAAGRYRDAVAHLLLGAMSHVERTGIIRFRRGLTYRDYLRALRGRHREYESLRTMVRVYEPLGFGRREATLEHFETTLGRYEAGFSAA